MQSPGFKHLFFLVFPCFAALSFSHADSLSQEEALYQASQLQKQGSDASLQNSTTHAMQGLMDLAEQKQPSAIQHGYKSYGQYRNSEDLDFLRMKSRLGYLRQHTQNIVNSASRGAGRNLEPIADLKTNYNRLDPSFLRKGEAGKIADEFEKKSGMKRETFLKVMARASESTISPSDPKLLDKVISRFEGFVKEIPNAEFRKNIEKNINSVPTTVRTGLISKGVQKIAEIMAKMPPDKNAPALIAAIPNSPERSPAAAVAVVANPSTETTSPTPTAVTGMESVEQEECLIDMKIMPSESGYKGLAHEKFTGDVLGSVMQTAIDEQKEETIFKQVSKRYRAMTPKLSLMGETSP